MKRLLSLALLIPAFVLAQDSSDDGFTSLFNGKDMQGWAGDPKFWRVEDGAFVGEASEDNKVEENTFLYWKDGELDDFELKVKFKIEGGNSGIQIRSFLKPESKHQWRLAGYQADFDADNKWSGLIYGEQFRGILCKPGEIVSLRAGEKPVVTGSIGEMEALKAHHKAGEWNEYHIICKGFNIKTYMNGHLVADLTDEDEAQRRRSGLIGFQLHVGPPMKASFKDIRVKRLPLEDVRKVVFLAGVPSHGAWAHEHNGGCRALANALNDNMGDQILATVYQNGWPSDPTAFENADAVVMYCDGGGRHFANFHVPQLAMLSDSGVGIGAIHYAVEIPAGDAGDGFLDWMGGYFEANWSVNPHWDPEFREFPDHPVANGVKPFTIRDEWYFHMRFRDDMKGVTPILSAVAPAETMSRKDGAHSGNPHVRKAVAAGLPQHVCWVSENESGSRGFGFTGGHFHKNWMEPNFRKTVLNAIAWIAKVDVPEEGVESPNPTEAELEALLDQTQKTRKPRKKPAPRKEAAAK